MLSNLCNLVTDLYGRCASTGRNCEGYVTSGRNGSSSPDVSKCAKASPVSPRPGKQLQIFGSQSPKELRSIELFFLKAAPQLSGYFQEPFWNFVLQLSFNEVSIRHAIVAVSAVYEDDCMVWESPCSGTVALKKLSFDYYNRAIRTMVKRMQEKDSIIVPVIGCLLFVCLEFLRRDIWAAIKHIDGGIKMIEQAREKRGKRVDVKRSGIRSLPQYEHELVERMMAPLFSSLNITASVFGRPGVYFFTKNIPYDDETLLGKMENMEQALASLLDMINAGTKFVHDMGRKKYNTQALEVEDYLRQDRLIRIFDDWKIAFDALEQEQGHEWASETSKGQNMLRAVHLTVRMWLLTGCSAYESTWDAYKPEFEELLRLIEDVTTDAVRFPDAKSKLFSFELGIIPPLELVARKCRYPKIRRKALQMLRTCPTRECLFDSFYSALLDERVMELEEMSFKLSPGQIPDENELPPENARIHLMFFAYEETPGLKGWPVSFLSKPEGIEGEWNLRKELLDVEENFGNWKPVVSPFHDFNKSFGPRMGLRPGDFECLESPKNRIPFSPQSSVNMPADVSYSPQSSIALKRDTPYSPQSSIALTADA